MSVFEGVVGQDAAAAALARHLDVTRGAGGTLIVGPEGVGRFLLAHRAARAILGATPESAARVESLQHADLLVLEPGDGIDGVRDAAELLVRRPVEGERTVLIVRDLERFSLPALNALLKTLEEPPAGAAIILIAEGTELLPETIVSRCRIVRTRALTRDETRKVLEARGAPPELAEDADGSPGRALARQGLGIDAGSLLALFDAAHPDPLGEIDKIVRHRPGEENDVHRRRLAELLQAAAARLRRQLPDHEAALRSVLEALGSLEANANAGIVFSDLVLRARHG